LAELLNAIQPARLRLVERVSRVWKINPTHAGETSTGLRIESFLVLFFKKEPLLLALFPEWIASLRLQ